LKRIRRYIALNAANPDAHSENGIAIIYQRELRRRRWERQDEREAERARKLKWNSLVRKSQAVASQAASMRRAGDKRAPIWERRAGILAAEEARRIEAGEAPPERLKGKRATTVDEALLLAEIQEARRRPATPKGTPGRHTPPPTLAQPPQLDLFASVPQSDGGIVGRLYRLKVQRDAQLAGGSP
jgi:hypothetical protein